jgi:hypothetical protein
MELLKTLSMAIPAKEIIAAIEKDFPRHERLEKKNFLSYFIGVHPDVSRYEDLIKESLEDTTVKSKHHLWLFHDYELKELRTSLIEISDYVGEKLDIDGFFKGFFIHDRGGVYNIVITVKQYPILSDE